MTKYLATLTVTATLILTPAVAHADRCYHAGKPTGCVKAPPARTR